MPWFLNSGYVQFVYHLYEMIRLWVKFYSSVSVCNKLSESMKLYPERAAKTIGLSASGNQDPGNDITDYSYSGQQGKNYCYYTNQCRAGIKIFGYAAANSSENIVF